MDISKRGDFVGTMIDLGKAGKSIRVPNDQFLTPIYTRDLAQWTKTLVETDAYGLYHITNGGHYSWYDFAKRIFEPVEFQPDSRPIKTAILGARARRPAYSGLAQSGVKEARMGQPLFLARDTLRLPA